MLEKNPVRVGGISRTEEYRGYLFDIGGHRFFSKSKQVEDFWTDMLGPDLLVRSRLSRISHRGRFFAYPIQPLDALRNLGFWESTRCALSYLRARIFPIRQPGSYEDWMTNRFGHRLYDMFFRSYTEKVWGRPGRDLSADWAAQRIRGLSLSRAVLSALRFGRGTTIKTLIESFRYPRQGPGMLWEAVAARIRDDGGKVQLGARVEGLVYTGQSPRWRVRARDVATGAAIELAAEDVLSSAPLDELLPAIEPRPRAAEHALRLRYRGFLTVVLIVRDRGKGFPDQWLYIHEPSVRVGRIQNFKAWSPEMVPDPETVCYGLEYFCDPGDETWSMDDADLRRLAVDEMARLGLLDPGDVLDGCVERQEKAYPVYDHEYGDHLAAVREDMEARYPGWHFIGRNGLHRYNNQDHAVMTGWLAARNVLAGEWRYDVWRVNEDAEYLEEQHDVKAAGENS